MFLKNPFYFICTTLIILWFANHSVLRPSNYDSGLYHINSIRWIHSYAIVPGLGNLHGRLAFNSSYFLYAAFLDIEALPCRSYHLANGFLYSLFYMQVTAILLEILFSQTKIRPSNLFLGMSFFPCFFLGDLSSPSPDLPQFFLSIILAANFLWVLENTESSEENFRARIIYIVVLTAAGTTIKFSFFPLAISTLFISFLIALKTRKDVFLQRSFQLKTIFIFVSFLVVWMIRGIILSGYIAYPFPWGSFPVEWKVPHASAINMANWTIAWNRMARIYRWEQVLNSWDWVGPWISHLYANLFSFIIPLFLTLIGFIVLLWERCSFRKKSSFRFLFYFFIPPFISILCWFLTAPNIRFATSFFWLLGLGALAISFGAPARQSAKIILIALFLFLLNIFNPFPIAKETAKIAIVKGDPTGAIKYFNEKMDLIFIPEKPFQFYLAPEVPVKRFITDWGLVVYTLDKKDQGWDPPLPFTPYPHPKLRLRKGNMQSGFIIDPHDDSDSSVGMHEEWVAEKWGI